MAEKTSPQVPLDALNALYSLCLLIILTFAFHFDESSKSVEPSVSGVQVVLIGIYLTYFMLDWASSQSYRHTPLETAFVFWSKMISVPFLTVAILSLYSKDDWQFVTVSAYATVVAGWDAWFLWRAAAKGRLERIVPGLILSAVRGTIAVFLLFPALIAIGRVDVMASSRVPFWWLSIALVVLKLLRTIYLSHVTN